MFGYERCVTSFWDVPGGVDGDDGLNVLEEVDLGVGSGARGRFNGQEQSLVRRDFSEKKFQTKEGWESIFICYEYLEANLVLKKHFLFQILYKSNSFYHLKVKKVCWSGWNKIFK